MVSFVTKDFYKKLQPTCGCMKREEQMLTLHAVNGLEIMYMCYLNQEIEVDGMIVPICGILVLKDTPATSDKRHTWTPWN